MSFAAIPLRRQGFCAGLFVFNYLSTKWATLSLRLDKVDQGNSAAQSTLSSNILNQHKNKADFFSLSVAFDILWFNGHQFWQSVSNLFFEFVHIHAYVLSEYLGTLFFVGSFSILFNFTSFRGFYTDICIKYYMYKK